MISLEPQEKGAKAYSTLKSYTKDELIEEIRILEHNLAAKEEMYWRGVNRQKSIGEHFPQSWIWERCISLCDGGCNWRIMTRGIPIGDECYEIHKGQACKFCQAIYTCKYKKGENNEP